MKTPTTPAPQTTTTPETTPPIKPKRTRKAPKSQWTLLAVETLTNGVARLTPVPFPKGLDVTKIRHRQAVEDAVKAAIASGEGVPLYNGKDLSVERLTGHRFKFTAKIEEVKVQKITFTAG